MATQTIHITFTRSDKRDEVIALLGVQDEIHAVEEHADGSVSLYTQADPFPAHFKVYLEDIITKYQLIIKLERIEDANWNSIWEQNFPPVVVDDWCAVRAEFHQPINHTQYEILIHPKMAFGTGHHETTNLMINLMQELTLEGTRVLDFGCGTGILGILAAKCGAAEVVCLDNTEEAVKNTLENAQLNRVKLQAHLGSLELVQDKTFDIILANINRQVLVHYHAALSGASAPKKDLLLSGFMPADVAIINGFYEALPLVKELTKGNWCAQWRQGRP